MTTLAPSSLSLRPASDGDVEAIAAVWYRGWLDAHLGHVPAALEAHRGLDDLRQLVPPRLRCTTVATIESRVVGFVTVHDDEIEQIYVAESARGSGTADALLRHGEQAIAARFDRAWLAVAPGNARARRFYARNGWTDGGGFDYTAQIAEGLMPVPCRRYQKSVGRA